MDGRAEKTAPGRQRSDRESEERMSMSSSRSTTGGPRAPRLALSTFGVLLAALTGLLLAGTPALAAFKYPTAATGSFGEPCSGNPCGNGQFNEPTGVSVNQASEGTST